MNRGLSFQVCYIQVNNFTIVMKYIIIGQLKGCPVIILIRQVIKADRSL